MIAAPIISINVRKMAARIGRRCASFIVYHPDKEHPYKDTRPVPKKLHAEGEESILKVDSRHMITKSPNLEQIQTLTYTPRRYWIPFPGRAKRRKMIEYYNDNVDRPGLTS